MEWISVKDRLPPGEIWVLVITEEGHMNVSHKCEGEDDWYDSNLYQVEGVTHWMPLPEPPKE